MITIQEATLFICISSFLFFWFGFFAAALLAAAGRDG